MTFTRSRLYALSSGWVIAALAVGVLAPTGVVLARRAQVPEDRLPTPEEAEAPPVGLAAGAPVMIRPPQPPAILTADDVRAALSRARPDLEACIPAAGPAARATVRAVFSRRAGLLLRVQLTPRDPQVSRCLDTAARRWLVPLEARPIGPSVSAALRVRGGAAIPPPPPPPGNPPPGTNAYDEGLAHAALDRQRMALHRCLPVASTSTPGDITLRISVRPDGSMALEGATFPSGVGSGPVLSCVASLVASTRVPSPPTPRAITHIVTLGR